MPFITVFGVMLVSVGFGITVNVTELLVPLEVVTVTLVGPVAAVPEMENVTLICEELLTNTLPTEIPGLATFTVAPVMKLLPLREYELFVPWIPLAGLIDVTVGACPAAPLQKQRVNASASQVSNPGRLNRAVHCQLII